MTPMLLKVHTCTCRGYLLICEIFLLLVRSTFLHLTLDLCVFVGMAFVLLIVPCAMESGQEVAKKTCVDIKGNNSVLFDSFEDDVYFQESLCAYAFKSANSENTLAALLVPMSSLISCVSQIQALTAA